MFILGAGGMVCNSAIMGATGNMAAWLGMLVSFVLVTALVLLMGVISALLYMKLNPPITIPPARP